MIEKGQAEPLVTVQILRAIAALAVTVSHFHHEYIQVSGGTTFGFGGFGVDLFFVISGFIMAYACWSLFGQSGAAANFFLRRLARIVPLYWAATGIFLAYVAYTQPLSQADLSLKSIVASFLFIPLPRPSGIPYPALSLGWTLNYEMFFYVVFASTLSFRRTLALSGVALLLGTVAIASRDLTGISLPWSYWASPMVIEFVLGIVIASLFMSGVRISKALAVIFVITALMLAAWVYITSAYKLPHNMFTKWGRAWWWGMSASLILAAAVLTPWQLKGLIVRGFTELGDSSYAIYLLHPLFMLIYPLAGMHGIVLTVRNWFYVALLLVLAMAVSIVVFRYLERPMTRRLYRLIDRYFPVQPLLRRVHRLS